MHFVTIFHKLSASPAPIPHFCSVTTTAPHRQKNTTTKLAFVVRDCTKTRNFTGHLVSLVHNSDRTYRETMLLYAPNPTPPHHAASQRSEGSSTSFPVPKKKVQTEKLYMYSYAKWDCSFTRGAQLQAVPSKKAPIGGLSAVGIRNSASNTAVRKPDTRIRDGGGFP